MQQDRGGRGGSDQGMKQSNQQQDQRLKALTAAEAQQQQQPPQKCPRCDSLNTKFCYYNNYSLTQPRYFCKTCRRYWTQGGTLRNVPVGGGCRKGKRTKISSSSGEDSRPTQAPLVPPQQTAQTPLSMTMISSNPMISVSAAFRTEESGGLASSSAISSIGSYYPGAGFLSSLASIQSMNQPQPQPSNQPALNQGPSIGGGSSNLGLLQGYGVPFGSQQHHPVQVQQTQFFPIGDRDQKTTVNMYPSDQERLIQSSRLAAANSSQQNWHHHLHQGFINNSDPTVSETAMWSINNNSSSSTSSAGKTNTSNTTGGSLNPNQWPDLPGYGAPP